MRLRHPERKSQSKSTVVIRHRHVPALGERRLVTHYSLEYVTRRFKHFCIANANITIVFTVICAYAHYIDIYLSL